MEGNSDNNNKVHGTRADDDSNNGQDTKALLESARHNYSALQERHNEAALYVDHCVREQVFLAERIAKARAKYVAAERDLLAAHKEISRLQRLLRKK